MAIKIQGTTVIDDSRNATALTSLSFNNLTLDGLSVDADPQEINHLDGVTDNIQTQIDSFSKDLSVIDQSFTENESLLINLSESVSNNEIPAVSVTKEVSFNGSTVDKIAIPGVDYDYDLGSSTEILFKALSSENFKIRIIA